MIESELVNQKDIADHIAETLAALADHADPRLLWLHHALLERIRYGKPTDKGSIEGYLGTCAPGRGMNDAWKTFRLTRRDDAIREAAKLIVEQGDWADLSWLRLELCGEIKARLKHANRKTWSESKAEALLQEAIYYDPKAAKLSTTRIYDILIS